MRNFRHVTPIEVRFRDLDAFGHVNNGVFFTYIETARIRYLVDVGVRSPQKGWNDLAFILAHINCDFRRPIFYDQRVEVGSRIVEIKQSSMRLAHRIEADGELAAEGDGVLVHYDYATQSSMPISAEMRAKIAAFEQTMFDISS
jgi:acyl-CoA thioester hydrolase